MSSVIASSSSSSSLELKRLSMPAPSPVVSIPTEIESAKCDCCGLTEECTPTYIAKVRERYQGRWLCGLCGEAVKDEVSRSGRMISAEEALSRHISFCNNFRSSTPPTKSAEQLISAVRHIVRRSFDSPRALKSTPSSPVGKDAEARRVFARSESCFPALTG